MRKAYINFRANVHKEEGANEVAGFTTLLVMNGKKFIAADFGGYKVVVCKDGAATQIGRKNKTKKRRSFISGAYSGIQKQHIIADYFMELSSWNHYVFNCLVKLFYTIVFAQERKSCDHVLFATFYQLIN